MDKSDQPDHSGSDYRTILFDNAVEIRVSEFILTLVIQSRLETRRMQNSYESDSTCEIITLYTTNLADLDVYLRYEIQCLY